MGRTHRFREAREIVAQKNNIGTFTCDVRA